MRRRRFLAASGALAAFAGCIERSGSSGDGSPADGPAGADPGSGTQTDSPGGAPTRTQVGGSAEGETGDDATNDGATDEESTERDASSSSAETASDATVEISKPSAQAGVVVANTPDSITVRTDAAQYLLARAEVVDGAAPELSSFAFSVAGETYRPPDYTGGHYRDDGWRVGYRADAGAGWLVFGLPETVGGDDGDAAATLSWPGGEWTPPATVRERLASPTPSFDVEFDAPDDVAASDSPTLSIAVTNTGDVAGRCVLALNRVGPLVAYTPVRRLAMDLEPGATATREYDAKSPYDTNGDPNSVTYHLDTPAGERISRTIEASDKSGE